MIDQEIQARMNAFRGNPQALMQRYSQNQQLIDLLALQKLKSEKEAAMRQMQMQAGQGQMPTVAQQREQELMGMAKQEVADRVGQVAQQQAKQQQENLQRAAQTGIAQAPAPNMMPPQAMASGGIVAFAGGGDTAFTRGAKSLFGIKPPTEEEAALRKRREELSAIQSEFDMGPFQGAFTLPAEEYDRRAAVRDYIQKNRQELLANPRLFAAFKANPDAFVSGGMRTAVGQITPAPTAPTAPTAPGVPPEAAPPPAAQMQGGLPPPGLTQGQGLQLPPRPGAGAMPAGAPQAQGIAQAAPRATMEQKLPGEPAEIGGGKYVPSEDQSKRVPMQTQDEALRAAYSQTGIGALTAKPEAMGISAEEAYAKRFDPLFQKQMELKQQGIAEAQRLAERERGMRDPLTAYLLGARGRTIGEVLGSAGRAGGAYQQEALTRDQALAKQLQDLQEAQLGAQITQEKEKYGVGEARRKEAADERKAAYGPTGQFLTGMAAADARRDIADLQAQVRQAAAKTQDMEQRARMAEAAYKGDPEVENIQNELKTVDAKINPEKAAQLKARMRAIQIEKYRLFSVEVPPELAAAAAGAAPSTGAKTIPFSQLKSAGK